MSTCNVSSTNGSQCLGGISGGSYGAKYINCFNGGRIKSTQTTQDCEMGGICGIASGGEPHFYNCYNYSAIDSGISSEYARGGIVGENYIGVASKVVNCYSMSGVAGNKVYGTGSANSTTYGILKGNALFNSSTQIITPFDSGVTTRYVYNIATDAATSMPATTTLLEALNKFVELNPVMEGVKLSPWYIGATYPDFALMGEVT